MENYDYIFKIKKNDDIDNKIKANLGLYTRDTGFFPTDYIGEKDIKLDDKKTTAYLKAISETLGLSIDLGLSTLNGICPKCKENQNEKNK